MIASRSTAPPTGWAAALVAALGLAAPPAAAADVPVPAVCRAAAPALAASPDPFLVVLAPTARANGAAATARLRFAASPFGIALTEDGRHRYHLRLEASGLDDAPPGERVVWVATPELDRVHKLGVLGPDGAVGGEVAFNKFLVFVTAEPSADVERWSGPILLRGISRSGRLHTMQGHGPFEGEPC